MTFPRLPGSADERDAEAVVAVLRRELLAPMDEDVVAGQLEAMLLEFDWEQEAEPAACRPRVRTPAVIGSCLVAIALSLTGGLAAAGALPATAQHWLSRVTRIIGIPVPDAPRYGLTPSPTHTDPPRFALAPTVLTARDDRWSVTVQPQIAGHHPNRSTPSTRVPQPTQAGAHPSSTSDASSSPPADAVRPPANEGGNSSAGDHETAPNRGNGNGANAEAGKSAAAHVAPGPTNAHAAPGPTNAHATSAGQQHANPTGPSSKIDAVTKNAVEQENAVTKNAVNNNGEKNGAEHNP